MSPSPTYMYPWSSKMAPQDSHVNPFEETETSADIFVEEVDNFLNFTGAERPKYVRW